MFEGSFRRVKQEISTLLLRLEDARLRLHLHTVEQRLRSHDPSHLPPHIRQQRQQQLEHLHSYWQQSLFPRNYSSSQRPVPCFIDTQGRVCAVGYLVMSSDHTDLAYRIGATDNTARIHAMCFPELDLWACRVGLSKAELQQIQPGYCFSDVTNAVWPALLAGIGSTILVLLLTLINSLFIRRPVLQLLLGICGILLGGYVMYLARTGDWASYGIKCVIQGYMFRWFPLGFDLGLIGEFAPVTPTIAQSIERFGLAIGGLCVLINGSLLFVP